MKLLRIPALLSLLMLGGCANTGLMLLNASIKLGADHNVKRNLQYGGLPHHRLDLHVPNGPSNNARPVLIFFYGGGWYYGSKEQYFFAADAFTRRGYLVVIPDYIKAPEGRFPEFIEDGAAAIAWVKANIADHGGNPEQIFVAGHSAGAHLGGLVVSDAQYLAAHGLKPQDISGFAGLAGPYNFTPGKKRYVKVFAPEENYPKMKIMNHINGDEPPMLLMHGMADTTVGVANKNATIERLQQAGVHYQDIEYDGVSHAGILLSLTPRFAHQAPSADDIHRFFSGLMN